MNRAGAVALTGALAASLTANVLMYLRYSSSRPLLRMGDVVVTRKDYRDALESRYGKAVLTKLVLSRLIEREAKRTHNAPTDQDVKQRLALIAQRQPQIVAAAESDPARMAELKHDVSVDLALENLRIRNIRATPAEIEATYRRDRDAFTVPTRVETTTVVTQNATDAATAAEDLRQGLQPDEIARQPRMRVVGVNGYQPDTSHLPASVVRQLQATMAHMHPGDVATVPVGPDYLTFAVRKQENSGVLPLSAVRGQAERLARLEKAPSPSAVLASLYRSASPVFEENQYASYFDDLKNGSTEASAAGN